MTARADGPFRAARMVCAVAVVGLSPLAAAAQGPSDPEANGASFDGQSFGVASDYGFGAAPDVQPDPDYAPFAQNGFRFDGRYEIGVVGDATFADPPIAPHAAITGHLTWRRTLDNGLTIGIEGTATGEYSRDGWDVRLGD